VSIELAIEALTHSAGKIKCTAIAHQSQHIARPMENSTAMCTLFEVSGHLLAKLRVHMLVDVV